MAQTAGRIGSGDLSARVAIERGDELGDLGNSLNDMAAALDANSKSVTSAHEELKRRAADIENASQALSASEEQFRLVFDDSPSSMLFVMRP